jgi:hypothetical protein
MRAPEGHPRGAKDIVRNVTRSCIHCFKARPKSTDQFTGELPSPRVISCHGFLIKGVDYSGHVFFKINRRTITKAYISLFECLATKAIHLVLVSELSSQALIAALHRFTTRRGDCQHIYSDNATNYVVAKFELTKLYDFLNTKQQRMFIQTHKIPFYSANSSSFQRPVGGGYTPLTFEEMSTVLTKIEAILNFRLLVPESNDLEEVTALTPGQFLIGRPLVAMAEPNFLNVKVNLLRRW